MIQKQIANKAANLINSNPNDDYFTLIEKAGWDLSGLQDTDIEGLTIFGHLFEKTDFTGSNFANSTFIACNFVDVNLEEIDLTNAHFILCNFSNCRIDLNKASGLQFTGCFPFGSTLTFENRTVYTQKGQLAKDLLSAAGCRLMSEDIAQENCEALATMIPPVVAGLIQFKNGVAEISPNYSTQEQGSANIKAHIHQPAMKLKA